MLLALAKMAAGDATGGRFGRVPRRNAPSTRVRLNRRKNLELHPADPVKNSVVAPVASAPGGGIHLMLISYQIPAKELPHTEVTEAAEDNSFLY